MAMNDAAQNSLHAYYTVDPKLSVGYAGDIDKSYWQQARVGVAPYIGDYGDVHTWLMLQVEHAPSDRYPVTITPLVRLFQGTKMLEAGVSTRGDVLLNLNLTF